MKLVADDSVAKVDDPSLQFPATDIVATDIYLELIISLNRSRW